MTDTMTKRVSYDIGCMKSLRKLPDRVALRFMDLMTKYMSDPSANGLNLETVEGSRDSSINCGFLLLTVNRLWRSGS